MCDMMADNLSESEVLEYGKRLNRKRIRGRRMSFCGT